jgi:hypothetical protein
MSAVSITKLGMVGCDVLDQTVRAVIDIPGVLAIFLKGGACGFGDAASVLKTLWQSEQTFCAYASPLAAPRLSAASPGTRNKASTTAAAANVVDRDGDI